MTTTVRLKPKTQEALNQLAIETQRSRNWLMNKAIEEFLAQHQREKDTIAALQDVKEGSVVEGETVFKWMENWGSENDLSAPLAHK